MPPVKARNPTALLLAALSALSILGGAMASGCGAEDVDAVETPQLDVCPSVDEYLVDAGGLDHLEGVIGGDLDRDARADLVATIIDLVGALKAGTFVALGTLADAADASSDLEDTLAGAVRVLATDGPGAPYPQALGGVRVMLHTCEGPPLLQLVLDLLEEPTLLTATSDAVAALGDSDIALDIPLDLGDPDARPAIRALLTNVLTALTGDDVNVEPLLELVGLLLPEVESPPWSDLLGAVEELMAPGPHRDAIAGLASCLLAADPQLGLLDLLLDVLDTVDLGSLLSDSDDTGGAPLASDAPDGEGTTDTLGGAVTALLELLIDDAASRRVLADLLTALVADHAAAGVLADVAGLLEAHVVGDIVAVLGALATRSCSP